MTTTFQDVNELLGRGASLDGATAINIASFSFVTTSALDRLLAEIDYEGCAERDAYKLASSWAAALPEDLQRAVLYFARHNNVDALVIHGLPVGSLGLRATPTRHGDERPIRGFEALCLAVAMLYGNPVGYATQQNGRLVNDIVPVAQQAEISNHSGGFLNRFDFHTEDAFMAAPPDFIQLACVRNPTETPLTLAGIGEGSLEPSIEAALRTGQYRIGINPGHSGLAATDSYVGPLVTGAIGKPNIRLNEATTKSLDSNEGEQHLKALDDALNRNCADVPLSQGDLVIVKNRRLAHARRPYSAKCDGTDRWLLRLVTYRNLDSVQNLIQDPGLPILQPKVNR